MKKLLELQEKLIAAKEELVKSCCDEVSKKEHKDEKEDKKQIEEKLDEHNEKKHDEPKDEDSAFKSEMVKFDSNGQWSINKAETHGNYAKKLVNPSNGVGQVKDLGMNNGPVKTFDKDSKEVKEANSKK